MSPDLSRQALQTCRLTLARSYIDQDLIAGQPYLDAWESLDRGEQ